MALDPETHRRKDRCPPSGEASAGESPQPLLVRVPTVEDVEDLRICGLNVHRGDVTSPAGLTARDRSTGTTSLRPVSRPPPRMAQAGLSKEETPSKTDTASAGTGVLCKAVCRR